MMATFFKLIKNLLLFLVIFILVLGIFLYIYYGILAHNIKEHEKAVNAVTMIPISHTSSTASIAHAKQLNLLPVPKKVHFTQGFVQLPRHLVFQAENPMEPMILNFLKKIPEINPEASRSGGFLQCVPDTNLPVQGYRLIMTPGQVTLNYKTETGLYYGLVTLKVLTFNYRNHIPCMILEDYPDLAVRGVMLDISRDKIPTLQTLEQIVQLLADLKFNHLELYIEGFSFAYSSFQNLWKDKETPLTGLEIRKLDSICRENFIDLVPNQNSLGHMTAWLATPEYRDLAECPQGYKLMGLIKMKSTLDPNDPRSIQLVSRMTDDLLPNFTSSSFNVNLDEPFELGEGKSKKLVKKIGLGAVYLHYVLKMDSMVKAHHKNMLMWGDIALKHPEILKKLPKDITLLDWGYDAGYPFQRNCMHFDSTGTPYMVCPGTSSWTSITGRTDNMLRNIDDAAKNGIKFGAKGLLVTDWGDMGHWQYLPVSYAGYATAAALSWNVASYPNLPLARFLSSYVFRDETGRMGQFVLNMGRYNRFEEFRMFNMTTTMMAFELGLRDKVMVQAIMEKMTNGMTVLMKDIAPQMIDSFEYRYQHRRAYDYKGLMNFLHDEENELGSIRLDIPDSQLVRREYKNAIRLITLGAEIKMYIHKQNRMTLENELLVLNRMDTLCSEYLHENRQLWMQRNKPGGYDLSIAPLKELQESIHLRSEMLHKTSMTRKLNRFFQKLTTSAAVIYLKMGS